MLFPLDSTIKRNYTASRGLGLAKACLARAFDRSLSVSQAFCHWHRALANLRVNVRISIACVN